MPMVEEKIRPASTETLAALADAIALTNVIASSSEREGTTIIAYIDESLDLTGGFANIVDATRLNDLGRPSILVEQLSGYENLPLDWDGDGGVPTTQKAADTARRILEFVEALAVHLGMESSVDPLPGGGIDMEWVSHTGNQLLVEIQPLGGDPNFSVCIINKNDGMRSYWSDRVYNLDQVLTLLLQLDW